MKITPEDEIYMYRAFELAEKGKGSVSPNPMVGCVIVYQQTIIGEGWHQKYGDGHAEVNAINSVQNKTLLADSTVYVTLEPCAHFGKTPPCADLLIKYQVKRVVIANIDPFPLVAGKGIERMKKTGIQVDYGILEVIGRKLNCRFFTNVEKQRPYIILKWAETFDGFIGTEGGFPVQISNQLSQTLVHKWRSEEDAILVGYRTALHDNPRLNVRYWKGRNPIRFVIDEQQSLPNTLHLFDKSQETICIPSADITKWLEYMQERKVGSVIVEGGRKTLEKLIQTGLFDEIRVFKSPKTLKKGILAPSLPKNLKLLSKEDIQGDELLTFIPSNE